MNVLAAEAEINPLLPQTAEIVVALIAFGILYWFVAKVVAPRFEQVYQERTAAIEGGLSKAEDAQREAAAALEQYQAQLADARGEASRIREEAREQGAQIVAEMREQAQAEAARILASAQTQIETGRAAAVSSLRTEVGSLAVTLAGKIVGEQMADTSAQSAVVDRFIADLEAQGQDA
jgi:F-type H+-transporting ATPase subunit b